MLLWVESGHRRVTFPLGEAARFKAPLPGCHDVSERCWARLAQRRSPLSEKQINMNLQQALR